jgi:hypothetical protein
MKAPLIRALAGASVFVAGLASAQTYSSYSAYPTYGYAASSGIVRCESTDSRRRLCRADTRGGVQLYRQLSRTNCVRGRNWQVTTGGILVDDGCRAEFALGSRYGTSSQVYTRTDRYGRPIYDGRTGQYGGGYAVDRYGNRVRVDPYGNNSGYGYDGYGDRGYRDPYGYGDEYGYGDDGDRIYVQTGAGGYYTDRYGRRIYDDDYDATDETYERNRDLGYGGAAMPTTLPMPASSSTSTYGNDIIYCQAAASGRTYCGDATRTYRLRPDNARCLLERSYGRDSLGTWVSDGCNLRLENRGY